MASGSSGTYSQQKNTLLKIHWSPSATLSVIGIGNHYANLIECLASETQARRGGVQNVCNQGRASRYGIGPPCEKEGAGVGCGTWPVLLGISNASIMPGCTTEGNAGETEGAGVGCGTWPVPLGISIAFIMPGCTIDGNAGATEGAGVGCGTWPVPLDIANAFIMPGCTTDGHVDETEEAGVG
eukprot:scaffold38892_cov32-Tisochrysis_lutea.AAC.7